MKNRNFILCALLPLLLAVAMPQSFGQAAGHSQGWTYALLEGSELLDDCPICGRPTIPAPMRGGFRLRLIETTPLFTRYAIEDLSFFAEVPGGRQYRVSGGGTYQIGGEVAVTQQMSLQVEIDDGVAKRSCTFSSDTAAVTRLWPMIQITLPQTDGTLFQTYDLQLNAAPLREIWFSTLSGFHAGTEPLPASYVSPGDLISSAGHVVKRNHELTSKLGIMPVAPDVGLDAVDILPGGELVFSIETDIFSESLGPLHHGDALSAAGRVVRGYASFIGGFTPQPPIADKGLDALQSVSATESYFSVETNFFSQKLGRTIRRGDLLSSLGRVVKTNEELLAHFRPAGAGVDYGLDAVYVWPSGEIWFSTETGFTGPNSEAYGPGDLLSDQGYVVYRNLELLGPFQPMEDVSNFGLDSLFVVTDATPVAATPRFTSVRLKPATGSIELNWEGQGRVFQIERVPQLTGSWTPVSTITTDRTFEDPGITLQQPKAFYRILQW